MSGLHTHAHTRLLLFFCSATVTAGAGTACSNDAPAAQTAAAKPKGTAAGGGAVLEMLQGQFGDLNRRGRVALELLTTERVYCECLTSTINAFLIPLRTGLCPTFDRRYLPTLFVNIDKILAANTKFLHEIEYLVVC